MLVVGKIGERKTSGWGGGEREDSTVRLRRM